MAGQVSKDLGTGLMQAMLAIKTIRPQRDRLLQLRRQFQQLIAGDDAAGIQELAPDLFNVYFMGIECGGRYLNACLELAIKSGVRIAFNTALGVIPDEQQYDVLLGQPLPERPATQSQAFALIEAAFNASSLHLTEKAPHVASSLDRDLALTYLHRVCSFVSLAVSHIDLAIAVISSIVAGNGVHAASTTTTP